MRIEKHKDIKQYVPIIHGGIALAIPEYIPGTKVIPLYYYAGGVAKVKKT